MTNADFLMAGALSSIAMSRAFAGTMDSAETARVANRLLALDAPAARSAASSMIAAWAQADPEAALDWVVANANRLDAFPLSTVSQQAVRSDAERAIGMLDSLAGDARAQWLQGVASGLASRSIDQAAAFLQDHRGEPGFEQALTAVALSGRHEPEAAARLLAQAGSSPALGRAAGVVANAWVQRDPERAAAWALGLGDTEASSSAIASVAGGWARQDSDAARQWVQRLPTGQARDRALDGYLFATANAGALDTSVLSSFSADAARQQAMSRAIVQLGRQDPRQARVLLDRWITDPQLHSRTEEGLATTGGAGGLVIRFP